MPKALRKLDIHKQLTKSCLPTPPKHCTIIQLLDNARNRLYCRFPYDLWDRFRVNTSWHHFCKHKNIQCLLKHFIRKIFLPRFKFHWALCNVDCLQKRHAFVFGIFRWCFIVKADSSSSKNMSYTFQLCINILTPVNDTKLYPSVWQLIQ